MDLDSIEFFIFHSSLHNFLTCRIELSKAVEPKQCSRCLAQLTTTHLQVHLSAHIVALFVGGEMRHRLYASSRVQKPLEFEVDPEVVLVVGGERHRGVVRTVLGEAFLLERVILEGMVGVGDTGVVSVGLLIVAISVQAPVGQPAEGAGEYGVVAVHSYAS